ncbi:MAG: hypothetical protein AAGI71_11535 [Bacteroidota bacterium]
MMLVLLAHTASTLIMLGVILIVQVVHYPLFAKVGTDGFVAYERQHARLITFIVLPTMVIELATAVALAWFQPYGLPAWQVWSGLGLVGVIWVSTAFLQVPAHAALATGFDAAVHRRLVSTNWIRTVAWMARSVLALLMLKALLPDG